MLPAMKVLGKLLGGGLGLAAAGPLGAAVGLGLGHALDAGWLAWRPGGGLSAVRLRTQKVEFLFLWLGHLAKADGRVSESDVAFAERLMERLSLDAAERGTVIAAFERGRRGKLLVAEEVASFRSRAKASAEELREMLLALIEFARKEGPMTPAERGVLELLAPAFGIERMEFERLLAISKPNPAVSLQSSYELLGLAADSDDASIAKAYRRLVGQYHPDKLQGQGAQSKELRSGEEKLRAIRQAYERVMAQRKRAKPH